MMKRIDALLMTCLCACAPLKGLDNTEVENLVDDWRDEVVYQVLVDRFSNGDKTNDYNVDTSNMNSYHGGDWQGLIDRFDYLQALGVTTLWISPVVKNVESDAGISGYHGYWAQDFTEVNPHFGNIAKLRELVQKAHDRQMKVVLDIVTNHVGQLFFYDVNKNGQPDILIEGSGTMSEVTRVTEFDPDYAKGGVRSFTSLGDAGPAPVVFFNEPDINRVKPMPEALQSPDAYNRRGRVTDWNDADQVLNGDFPGGLKDLDTENPIVRRAMIDSYTRWAELIDFDGFRIDTVKHVSHGFWKEFCQAVRDHAHLRGKKNFVMFGEIFDGNDDLVSSYTRDGELDAVVNFPAKYQVFEDVLKWNRAPTQKMEAYWNARGRLYPAFPHESGPSVGPANLPFNFLDNHDVPRFLSDAPSVSVLDQALFLLMTMPGVPIIYYGTEQGFTGANDPSNREDLWDSGFDMKHPEFVWISKLASARKQYPALRQGGMTFRWTSSRRTGEDAGIIAFSRTLKDSQVLVVMNTLDAGTSFTSFEGAPMQTGFGARAKLHDVLSGQKFTTDDEGTLVLEVKARQSLLLVKD
jgi:alpha-amylase